MMRSVIMAVVASTLCGCAALLGGMAWWLHRRRDAQERQAFDQEFPPSAQ
jgi:ABC-type uncharacterized transport system permease subunit